MKALRRHLHVLGVLVLAGCARDRATVIEPADVVPNPMPAAERRDLTLPPSAFTLHTYDGSNQSVHPDVVTPGSQWGLPYRYLVSTPYPGGLDKFENPSLYASVDGEQWSAAPDAPFPLVKPTAGFLSDPDMLFDPDRRQLVLYYRQGAKGRDLIHVMTSPDGASWSTPTKVIDAPFASVLSPTIVRRSASEWLMWSVHSLGGCHGSSTGVELRRSTDGVAWSDPENVSLPLIAGRYAWHLDVQWIPSLQEYWALFPVKRAGTCATRELQMASSVDGVTWKVVGKPVVMAGSIRTLKDVVYRSTFAYDPALDEITFWYSGARLVGKKFIWGTAMQYRDRSEVFSAAPYTVMTERPVAAQTLSGFNPP